MKQCLKKLTAWLCCAAMLAALMPAAIVPAFAAEGTEFAATSGTVEPGSYYLSGEATLTGSLVVNSDVTIDLNGHTMAMQSGVDKSMFVITADGHLTIKDTGTDGKVQFATTVSGAPGVNVSGQFTLKSGTLTGWKRAGAGGMIYLNAGATFTMDGGLLTGCEAAYAGAIRAAGAGAAVNINGGTITGNNCTDANYSVVDLRGTADGVCYLNVTGGTIKGNTSVGGTFTSGGKEIYCRDTQVTITGGDLGHIYSLLSKLTSGDKVAISGKPVIQNIYVNDTDKTPATISKLVEGASITAYNTVFETDENVVEESGVYTYGVKEPAASDSLDFSADNSIKLSADVTTGGISLTAAGSYVLDLNADNEDIQWKVIIYHESPYGSSYHGNYTMADGVYEERPEQNMFVDMREYLLPGIYDRDFDVILSGHDHTYTRSHILKHEAVGTNGMYYGNETITPFENTFGSNYYTYADGTTSPTFVNWTDLNGTVHTDKKTASLPVKVTNPDGVLHITAASSSGSTCNAAAYEHPAAAVVNSGHEPTRQAVLVEVTPTSLTFTNYGLGTADEDYVPADHVIDTFTIERVEEKTGTVTVEQGTNGTISVDKTEGAYGETVTVTAKSDSGYKLKEILVDGTAITGKTFTISGDHVVTAVFAERGDEPLLGRFSLEVVNYVIVNGEEVAICRWVWTPFED